MKKMMTLGLTLMTIAGCTAAGMMTADAAKSAVTKDELVEGSYAIEVTSSSSMFKIVDCTLNVTADGMDAVMTLSGTGYEKLFMGTGEEALAADDAECIYFVEDADGMYTYTVPVEAMDQDIDCAAWSIRKQQWYDRVIVFESETLPEEAWADGGDSSNAAMIAGVSVCFVAAIGCCVFLPLYAKKKKSEKNA